MKCLRVVVIGAGYVGLVSSVCLAAKGHKVTCVELNTETASQIMSGNPHIYEVGLTELLRKVLNSGHFVITNDLSQAMFDADGVLIAVGTPTVSGKIDLSQIEQAAYAIGKILKGDQRRIPIIVKSTVLPGVTDTFVADILERSSGRTFYDLDLGMNPEFLREGTAVNDFLYPDRIVLGHENETSRKFLSDLYAPWDCEKIYVNSRTAELIKYANNALLAVQVSAINEIANIAYAAGGIDVMDVVRGVHLDQRWNPLIEGRRVNPGILNYLIPGCGYGGSCFPKDLQALQAYGVEACVGTAMLDAVIATNERQFQQVLTILTACIGDLNGKSILVLGLAFKPGSDDVREAPSLKIVSSLADNGANIVAHDPYASKNFYKALNGKAREMSFVDDWREHVCDAEIVLIITPWEEYLDLCLYDLSGKYVFDVRRAFRPENLEGAHYLAIGRADR